ncbi:MAG: hypothetical protein CV087_09725 [Candidatus Brocadia sp. WS118]|nr:MAG: hypothetical protein CV087_09725 [Candidatus Brocadia sp. WS118]
MLPLRSARQREVTLSEVEECAGQPVVFWKSPGAVSENPMAFNKSAWGFGRKQRIYAPNR